MRFLRAMVAKAVAPLCAAAVERAVAEERLRCMAIFAAVQKEIESILERGDKR